MILITEDYLETYYMVVSKIEEQLNLCADNKVTLIYKEGGLGSMWELAKSLTDEFEKMHSDTDWSEENWIDSIEEFLTDKTKSK